MSLRNAIGKQTVPARGSDRGEDASVAEDQRGKRAAEEYAQLNVMIPKRLKLRFKSLTALQDSDMSDVCEQLIRAWLDEQQP